MRTVVPLLACCVPAGHAQKMMAIPIKGSQQFDDSSPIAYSLSESRPDQSDVRFVLPRPPLQQSLLALNQAVAFIPVRAGGGLLAVKKDQAKTQIRTRFPQSGGLRIKTGASPLSTQTIGGPRGIAPAQVLSSALSPFRSMRRDRAVMSEDKEFQLQPRDELRRRFRRDSDEDTETSLVPDALKPEEPAPKGSNAALLAEIRALRKETETPPPGERAPREEVDLNGLQPRDILLSAIISGAVALLAFKFTETVSGVFNELGIDEDTFYVVARLEYAARYVLVLLGALGGSVSSIAALGQLALAAKVSIGIARGELDPNAKRVDPYGSKKQSRLRTAISQMLGQKET